MGPSTTQGPFSPEKRKWRKYQHCVCDVAGDYWRGTVRTSPPSLEMTDVIRQVRSVLVAHQPQSVAAATHRWRHKPFNGCGGICGGAAYVYGERLRQSSNSKIVLAHGSPFNTNSCVRFTENCLVSMNMRRGIK